MSTPAVSRQPVEQLWTQRWKAEKVSPGRITMYIASDASDELLIATVDHLIGNDAKNWTITQLPEQDGWDVWELQRTVALA